MDKPFPKVIDGCTVTTSRPDEISEVKGGRWVTMVPDDDGEDDRVWEFDLNTGRTLRIRA